MADSSATPGDAEPTPQAPAPASAQAAPDVTRQAGRGGLAVAFAKMYFMVTGMVVQIALPRVIGMGGYGALSNVLSIGSIAYNPVTSMSIQGVSRAVAHAPDDQQPGAIRRALSIHAALAIPFGVGFFLLAGPIGRAINAPHLIGALRIMSAVMFIYGLYTPLIGVLNGQKRFVYQAAFDTLAATLRSIGLVAGAWFFARQFHRGVEGAVIGFVVMVAIVLVAAALYVGTGRRGPGGPTLREQLVFIGPLLLGQTLLNLLLQADLTLLRTFAAESAAAQGLPLQAADPLVGAYRATQLFCFLPYQLLLAITFVLFPLLATAWRDKDHEAVARYVRTGVRLALVLAGAMVSVTSGLSGPLLRLVFPEPASEYGTRSMQLLALGFGAFAIFGILTTALNSLKRERASAAITALGFGLVVVLCWWRVQGQPFGADLLFRTASATSIGLAVAALGAAVLVKTTAGGVAPWTSLVRVLVAMTVTITVARHLPIHGKLLTVIASGLVAALYLGLLVVMRELKHADLAMVRAVVSRNQSA